MSTRETEDRLTKLINGEFGMANIAYDFANENYDAIYALLDGLSKNMDYYVLMMVILVAKRQYYRPNVEKMPIDFLKEKIVNSGVYPENIMSMRDAEVYSYEQTRIRSKMEDILCHAIYISSEYANNASILETLEPLKTFPSEKVRAHYCANIRPNIFPDTTFATDESPWVRGVFGKLYSFFMKYQTYNEREKECIEVLRVMYETGTITTTDGLVSYSAPGKMPIEFGGPLLGEPLVVGDFDADLCYTIKDKRLIADKMYGFVKEGKLVFFPGALPKCFQEEETIGPQGKNQGTAM